MRRVRSLPVAARDVARDVATRRIDAVRGEEEASSLARTRRTVAAARRAARGVERQSCVRDRHSLFEGLQPRSSASSTLQSTSTTTIKCDAPTIARSAPPLAALKSVVTPLLRASPLAAAAFATAPPRHAARVPHRARRRTGRARAEEHAHAAPILRRLARRQLDAALKEEGPRSAGRARGRRRFATAPARRERAEAARREAARSRRRVRRPRRPGGRARVHDMGFSHGVASRWWAGRRRARRRCRRGRCAAASSRSSAPCRRRRSRPTPSRRCRTCRTRAS